MWSHNDSLLFTLKKYFKILDPSNYEFHIIDLISDPKNYLRRRNEKRRQKRKEKFSSKASSQPPPPAPSSSPFTIMNTPDSSPARSSSPSFTIMNNNFVTSRGEKILHMALRNKITSYSLDPLHAGLEEYASLKRKMNMLTNSSTLLQK